MIRPTKNIKVNINVSGSITGKLNGSTIVVEPELENLEVIPRFNEQVFKSKKYGFDEVKVKGITAEVDEDIKPENIKAGINILGVEGGYEGVDTSDATATVEDIASGKTAYVNGQKIEGTVETITGSKPFAVDKVLNFGGSIGAQVIHTSPILFKNGSKVLSTMHETDIAEAIKLTPEQIIEGNWVLGVRGSAKILDTTDATALSEDILQNKTAYVNNEKITGTMQEYDGSYTGNGETGNEWEEILKSCIDKTYGSKVTKLPEGITSICNYAFHYCSNLALKELPESVTSIGNTAFGYCTNLTLTKLPPKLTSIGTNAFMKCTKLNISEIPAGVTIISSYAFGYCNGLKSITILGNITEFEGQAFYSAAYLEKVVIPNITSVPILGNSVFGTTPISRKQGYIYVPDNLVEEIKVATEWSTYASQIKPISELEG